MIEKLTSRASDVTVIVVTYNSEHCVKALAAGLADCAQVVIVDNGSVDRTVEAVQLTLPHARVIELGRNYGFGYANNRGMQAVTTTYACLLNPDCMVSAAHIEGLQEVAASDQRIAIVGPQLMRTASTPEINYRMALTDWSGRTPAATGLLCVGFVCGAVMLIRRQWFESVGGFDERFFLYYEDDDLCLRLRQRGGVLMVAPEIAIEHRSRGSVRTSKLWQGEYLRGYHHAQSKLTFYQLHRGEAVSLSSQRRLFWSTLVIFPIRVLAFSPRLIARMWGRLLGARRWAPLR